MLHFSTRDQWFFHDGFMAPPSCVIIESSSRTKQYGRKDQKEGIELCKPTPSLELIGRKSSRKGLFGLLLKGCDLMLYGFGLELILLFDFSVSLVNKSDTSHGTLHFRK